MTPGEELAAALAEVERLGAVAAEQAAGHGTALVSAAGADVEQTRPPRPSGIWRLPGNVPGT
jgi:hypothetical protein